VQPHRRRPWTSVKGEHQRSALAFRWRVERVRHVKDVRLDLPFRIADRHLPGRSRILELLAAQLDGVLRCNWLGGGLVWLIGLFLRWRSRRFGRRLRFLGCRFSNEHDGREKEAKQTWHEMLLCTGGRGRGGDYHMARVCVRIAASPPSKRQIPWHTSLHANRTIYSVMRPTIHGVAR